MYTHKTWHWSRIQILTIFSIHRNYNEQCIYLQTRSACIRFSALLVIFADNLVKALETSNTRNYVFLILAFWNKIVYRWFWIIKTKINQYSFLASYIERNVIEIIIFYLYNSTCNEKNRGCSCFQKQNIRTWFHHYSDHVKQKRYFNEL